MKKIITLLLICISFNSYSQDSTMTNVNVTEVERIVDKYGEKAIDGFNNLVDKVSPTAVQGFEYVVQLQIAKGIGMLLPILIFFVCLIVLLNIRNDKWVTKDTDTTITGIVGITSLIIGLFSIIMSFVYTYDGILHLLAPEWFAIKEIIELIK